jgi:NAD(P)-dependent dehydrogenase (short-subunit alcohol dehydrogenase family)
VAPVSAAELRGKVAVVAVEQEQLARRLAEAGATVVLIGDDAERAGRVVAAVEAHGAGRAAYFALARGDGSAAEADALVEFVAEQFRGRP